MIDPLVTVIALIKNSLYSKSVVSDTKSKQELNLVSETPKIDITSKEAEVILRNLVQQMNKSSTYFIRPKTVELMPVNQNQGEYRSRYTEVQTEQRALSKLSSSIKLKYYLQWFLTIFIHVVLFWYLPSKSNNATQGHYYCDYEIMSNTRCNEVRDNAFLIMFYLLYCLYFYFSAVQIRYGYPELKKSSFLMNNTTPINRIAYVVFRSVPFLLELKIFTDWSFTRTGLDVFQWIKFENIYGDLFVAKCINKGYVAHKIGDQVPKIMKFLLGILGTLGLVFIIAGPLLLFSSLNPIAQDNFVTGTTLDLSIEVNVTNQSDIINKYSIFHNDHVTIIRELQDHLYNKLRLGERIQTKNIKRYQMQEIMMSPTSDTTWDIAPPSQETLFSEISNARQNKTQSINLRMTYSFIRENPPGNQIVSKSIAVDVTKLPNNRTIIDKLYAATNPYGGCDNKTKIEFTIKDMYDPVLNLYETGDPEPIVLQDNRTDVTFAKSCRIVDNTSRHYWEITQDSFTIDATKTAGKNAAKDSGLIFVTVSEKITPSYLGNYSIIGFYTVIIYAIGTLLRRGKYLIHCRLLVITHIHSVGDSNFLFL